VSSIAELKKKVMKETHNSTVNTYPQSTKMNHDIKTHFWWIEMKKDVANG